jgi:hypothetical protein
LLPNSNIGDPVLLASEQKHNIKSATATTVTATSRSGPNDPGKCLSLDHRHIDGGGRDDDDVTMDRIISNAKQVYITMPAKSAGSSMKTFTAECIKQVPQVVDFYFEPS